MHKKILSRITVFRRHITVRLMLFSIIAIVPLNIISTVLVRQVADAYQNRLIESYQSQLDLYVSGVNSKIEYFENAVSNYLDTETTNKLNYGTPDIRIFYSNIYNSISNIRKMSDISSISFVTDKNNQITSLSSQPYNYDAKTLNQIKSVLTYGTEQNDYYNTTEKFSILAIQDAPMFIVKHYDFKYYSFGFLYNIEDILDDAYKNCNSKDDNYYFAKSDGTLIASRNEKDFIQTTISEITRDSNNIVIKQSIEICGYDLIRTTTKGNILEQIPKLINIMTILTFVSMLSLPMIWIMVSYLVLRPLKTIVKAMEEIEKGNFEYKLSGRTGSYQMDFIYSVVNHMASEINTLTIESYEKEIAKLQTDTVNLHLQVHPHTLLNSLNTIYTMAQSGETKTVMEFTRSLIDYFRYVLRQGESLVTIKSEIKFVKSYLDLQKIRFPNCFVAEYDIDEEISDRKIPPFIIENFVENSIKHGIVMGSIINVQIKVQSENEHIHIEVNDTGAGIDEATLEKIRNGEAIHDDLGNHIGIWNCLRRLKLYYGDNAVLKISSVPSAGTSVHIKLPLVSNEEFENLKDMN